MNNLEITRVIKNDNINYGAIAEQYTYSARYLITSDMVLSSHWEIRLQANLIGEELDAAILQKKIRTSLLLESRAHNSPGISDASPSERSSIAHYQSDPETILLMRESISEHDALISKNKSLSPICFDIWFGRADGSTQKKLAKYYKKRQSIISAMFNSELAQLNFLNQSFKSAPYNLEAA